MACEIATGQLISHPCGRSISGRCPKCSQEVCLRHYDGKKKLCVECAGTYKPSKGIIRMKTLFEFEDGDFDAFESQQSANDSLDYLDS